MIPIAECLRWLSTVVVRSSWNAHSIDRPQSRSRLSAFMPIPMFSGTKLTVLSTLPWGQAHPQLGVSSVVIPKEHRETHQNHESKQFQLLNWPSISAMKGIKYPFVRCFISSQPSFPRHFPRYDEMSGRPLILNWAWFAENWLTIATTELMSQGKTLKSKEKKSLTLVPVAAL